MQIPANHRPKIGIALSGGSGRAIAHVGVLEVLAENDIPIDYIAACSSGTMVAASLACGTLAELREVMLKMDRKSLLQYIGLGDTDSGMFSLEKLEEELRRFTLDKNFEDVRPILNFIACDIETAEAVSLNLGDLARAARISSSVPLWFPPVRWGNRLLVDGGLFSIIPTREVRAMGADIVIGVDIAATRQIIRKRYLRVWQGYNFLKKSLPGQALGGLVRFVDKLYEKTIEIVFYNQSDFFEKKHAEDPNLFAVLTRAMEIVADRKQKGLIDPAPADIMLVPDVKKYGPLSVDNAAEMLAEGRRAALRAIPEIKRRIKDFENQKNIERELKYA